jgi:hypothetical protein
MVKAMSDVDGAPRAHPLIAEAEGRLGLDPAIWAAAAPRSLALHVRRLVAAERCARWAAAVRAARDEWNADFGGEQFSLGRAWYTHLEEDRADDYFAAAASSDALVERHLPGMQESMRAIVGSIVGAAVRPRRGWCGPGVHVFPAGEHVSQNGGVIHFDLEGLGEAQLRARTPALTVVLMLAPATFGGGLELWDHRYDGAPEPDESELAGVTSAVLDYGVGSLAVLDSYRLHRILPFGGAHDRISITTHAAQLDDGTWESWF